MTTLVALATKDAVVMGCDSLGSVTKRLVDPLRLTEYFDPSNNYALKLDEDGKPLLKNFGDIYGQSQIVPFNHMTHVDKIFSLEPLDMGVMATGLASIGNFTIKNLINQFKSRDKAFKVKRPTNYTVKTVANRLLKFMTGFYEKLYGEWPPASKPELELMIGGYDKQKHIPAILRIDVHQNEIQETIKGFGIAFGGQMLEIQRIVFGTDTLNRIRLIERNKELLSKYYEEACNSLEKDGIDVKLIPKPNFEALSLFSEDWALKEFDATWGDFSDRNAIECVKFFIDVMIKSQQFSDTLPTVAGDIHVALINKTHGFRYVTPELIREMSMGG